LPASSAASTRYISSAWGLGCNTGPIGNSGSAGACASTTVAQPLNHNRLPKPKTFNNLFITNERLSFGFGGWERRAKRGWRKIRMPVQVAARRPMSAERAYNPAEV